jgi:hypothetical protein
MLFPMFFPILCNIYIIGEHPIQAMFSEAFFVRNHLRSQALLAVIIYYNGYYISTIESLLQWLLYVYFMCLSICSSTCHDHLFYLVETTHWLLYLNQLYLSHLNMTSAASSASSWDPRGTWTGRRALANAENFQGKTQQFPIETQELQDLYGYWRVLRNIRILLKNPLIRFLGDNRLEEG